MSGSPGAAARIAFTGLRPPPRSPGTSRTFWQIAAAGGIHAVIAHRFGLDDIAATHSLVDTRHIRGSAVVLIAEGGPGEDPGAAC